MNDRKKTKEQLLEELARLRKRVSKLREAVNKSRRDQRRLRENEERFRSVFEGSIDSILLADPETGEILDANPASEELLSMSREEIIGLHQSQVHPPHRRERAKAAFRRIANEADQQVPAETVVQSSDGKEKPVEILAQVIQVDGRPVVYGIFRDITERKRAEEALRDSEQLHKTIVDHARDVIYTIDTDTILTSLSPAFEMVTGWSRSEWIGRKIEEIVHPEDWPLVVEMGIRLFSGEKPPIHEVRIRTKPSGYITAEFSIAERIENGEVVGLIGIGRDITERKRMEAELQRAQKLESLGVLAGGIAHDFNNMLTPILANISIVKTFGDFDDGIAEALTDAEEACLRAKGLTQQLLAFSRGGVPVKKRAPLSQLLMDEVRFASSGSSVRWEYSIPEDLWWVEMDRGQIGQVIRNLIINADQAMPGGGTARIEAANATVGPKDRLPLKEGEYVRITVSDRGVGIPAKHLPRIFDPFYSTKDKGSGLGLSISHTIIKGHHGTIQVESEVGTGTAFHIYLPASERDTAVEEKEWTKTLRGEGRILLIDDDRGVRRSAQEMLRRLGYHAESAQDVKEGLELYRRARELGRPFRTVIMDLTIPGDMGGREAVKRLREVDQGAKIIVSSGYSDDPLMAGFSEYGFRAALRKPYNIQELAEVVHKVVAEGHD
jgi:two-component system cell cycle sensor histidine kinase/response regulator CckA